MKRIFLGLSIITMICCSVDAMNQEELPKKRKNEFKSIGTEKKAKKTLIQKLTDQGQDINVLSKVGVTPLHWAALDNNQDLMEKLINQGVDVNVQDFRGFTPFMLADSEIIVGMLLKAGADVNACAKDNSTALKRAILKVNSSKVTQLIDAGADFSIAAEELVNEEKQSECLDPFLDVFIDVVKAGNTDLAELMICKGSGSVNTPNRQGEFALQWAVVRGNQEAVKMLLDHGADVNAQDIAGSTALKLAINLGREELVEVLKAAGAQ